MITATFPSLTCCLCERIKACEVRPEKSLPELPAALQDRLMKENGVTAYQASVLAADRALCGYYEKAAAGNEAQGGGGELDSERFSGDAT